ncbi:radical SAM protein, partial [Dehalogenimonas sp. THU2]|uniref:SPL family radical SAM protein n=1 Tax=Dehalogenimonas sp. THU2 TaxID=3151121 RepID=UPI0032185EED
MNESLKAIRPSGTKFGYCINCYNGCEHGCLYCYGRIARKMKATKWALAEPRLSIVDSLKRDIQKLNSDPLAKQDIKDIMVCSVTDCYQPKELEHRLTRQVVELLRANDLPFTILTKSVLVLRDMDVFSGYDKCRVGLTITTLDENYRKQLELDTSRTCDKILAIEELHKHGVSTYCSVEPITPCPASNPKEIVKRFAPGVVDLFEFGMWTPKIQKAIPMLRYDEKYLVSVMQD